MGKYESKDVGVAFSFPPEDAARFKYFDDPDIVPFGPYELQFWWLTQRGWTSNGQTLTEFRPEMLASFNAEEPAISLSGQLLDLAPGAPGSPTRAGSFTYDVGDSVRVVSDGALATIVARSRRMPDIRSNQKPENHYGLQVVGEEDIRIVLEHEVVEVDDQG